MNKAGSVFSMGSGGATYEHHVQAAYLLAMLLKLEVPLVKNGTISEVAFQTTSRGFETDDLLVELDLNSGEKQIHLGQIKHNIVLTEANLTFNEVISAFWKDFNNPNFSNNKDRLLLITSIITKNDKNQIGVLLDWASTHKNEGDFYDEVERIAIKKQHLAIFENVLKKANNDTAVPKKEIWQFLNCMALVAYDFTTEASIHYNYVVNLISLTKAESCPLTGSQIWSELLNLASHYNLNGGSLTFTEIEKLDIYQNFNPSLLKNTSTAIEKLKNDGQIIIAPFENQIQDFHFDRAEMVESLFESVNKNQITIITGAAGAGKSALLKEFLESQPSETNFFIFKAEQFNENNLSHVFSKLGISHSISDILYSIGYLQKKIIVIDAMEKLLEADTENAFQQLLAQLKNYEEVKLIFTSRAYAVNLVTQKYNIPDLKVLEIEPLSDAELELALQNFPSLKPYYKNKGIKEILRSLKYLQFAVKTLGVAGLNVENLSLIDFKLKLWNHIIEKATETANGMPRKRGKAFSYIAINRAKSMRLFVEPNDQIAEEAVEALLKDNVIFKNELEYEFAPSHDILEDWALVKHISKIKSNASYVEEFFVQIGNQPALRRAFRLWVEDYLVADSDAIVDLVRGTYKNAKIEKYWVEELLISVFRSKNASSFFENFEEDLLENEGAFLKRAIVLAQTACKEYSYSSDEYKSILFPVGSVWEELLAFISKNIVKLSEHRNPICDLLMDWEFRFIFDANSLSQSQIKNCKEIVLHYIQEIENEEYYWTVKMSRDERTIKNLLYLLFNLAPFAKQEVESFLKRILHKQDLPWRVQSFYEMAAKLVLGGSRNQNLVKELPVRVIELANDYWKVKPKEDTKTFSTSVGRKSSSFLPPSRPDKDDSWGVANSRFDYFPPSIYKTFVHTLFLIKPVEAISFVTNFVNYSIDFYINSEYGKEHPLEKIILISKDGTEMVQYGDASIWAIYRGHMTTHHLLECLLMSLENYLLKLAQIDNEMAKNLLEEHCKYILQFSNNVALTSVIASVFMSNPKGCAEATIPIFSTRKFYEWDLNRSISEHTSMAPQDRENSNVQKERMASNALEHRRKYSQGLRAFLLPYEINHGKFNESLFEIFDRFYEKYSEDHIWIKTVSEMDARNLKPGKIDYDAGTIELETSYPEKISETLELIAEDFQDHHLDARYSNILLGTIQKKSEMAFEEWQEIYSFYSNSEYKKSMFDMPVSLASLGLNIFTEKLSEAEKQWSLEVLLESLKAFLKDKYSRSYGGGIDYNIMEKTTILQSTHLLLQNGLDAESVKTYKYWIGKLVLCPLDDVDLREFVIYFRNTFTEKFPDEAREFRKLVSAFAKFEKDNPRPYFRSNEEERQAYQKSFTNFLTTFFDTPKAPEINSIDFATCEKHYLIRTILMISPKLYQQEEVNFTLKVLENFVLFHTLDKEDSWLRSQSETEYMLLPNMHYFLSELILYCEDIQISQDVLNMLINPLTEGNYGTETNIIDLYKFTETTLNFCIALISDVVTDRPKEELDKYGSRFWKVWEFVFEKLKEKNFHSFSGALLLDNKYLKTQDNWSGFLNKKDLYLKMATYFGANNISPVVSVFSTFGEALFLPDGIILLEKLIKENPNNAGYLMDSYGKNLISKLSENHIGTIKMRQDLVNAFIYLLDRMIELESTEAYIIRENVIMYKTS